MKYEEINVGDTAFFEKTISESDVYSFAGITGDFNAIHINDEYAKKSLFKKRIAHGLFAGSLFSTVFGMKLPGEGSIYISQEFRFVRPVYIGDTIKASVILTDKMEKNKVKFDCVAINQDCKEVIVGTAVLMIIK